MLKQAYIFAGFTQCDFIDVELFILLMPVVLGFFVFIKLIQIKKANTESVTQASFGVAVIGLILIFVVVQKVLVLYSILGLLLLLIFPLTVGIMTNKFMLIMKKKNQLKAIKIIFIIAFLFLFFPASNHFFNSGCFI